MKLRLHILALFAIAAPAVFGAAAVSAQAASNELEIARRALGDENWYTAERRAGIASSLPGLRDEARLVQLEALARSRRVAEIPSRLESWGNPAGEPFRYWRAFALAETGKRDEARALLKAKFAEPAFALLAERLAARIEREAGNTDAACAHFAAAAAMLPSNAVARTDNAVEWARARLASGDSKGALAVLEKEGAVEAKGRAGDAARLFAAEIAFGDGDAKMARKLRERILSAGAGADEEAFVRASLAIADDEWRSGATNAALVHASNAVARAARRDLKSAAGFGLGFMELAVPSLRTNGMARVNETVRAAPDAPGAADALMRLAGALLDGGDAAEALKAYDLFLQAYPSQLHKVRALEGRGLALAALGRSTEAVGAFARAAQIATNTEERARCQFRQGDALLASGRFQEAANAYGAVRGTNLAAFAQFQVADALSRAGKHVEAAAQFRKVMRGGGRYAVEAGLRLASGATASGRTETALEVYNRLLGSAVGGKSKSLPELTREQRARALEGRGRANYLAYRFEDAERDFAEVVKLDAARAGRMRFFCSLCRYGAGRDDEAYQSAKKLFGETEDPSLKADLMLWLAKFDFAKRDYSAAFAAFEACATNAHLSAGRRLDALVRAARCAAAQSDYGKIIEIVSRVLSDPAAVAAMGKKKDSPETRIVAEALMLQGEALVDLARFDEAVLVLERASALPVPDDMRRRMAILKADCQFARGADNSAFYRKAADEYKAVQQDADASPSMRLAASFKLARALEKQHSYDDAYDQYYANVVMAYVDGVRAKGILFDGDARAFFARAAFILADANEASGKLRQAERVLRYVVDAHVPAAEEARRRMARLKKEGGFK